MRPKVLEMSRCFSVMSKVAYCTADKHCTISLPWGWMSRCFSVMSKVAYCTAVKQCTVSWPWCPMFWTCPGVFLWCQRLPTVLQISTAQQADHGVQYSGDVQTFLCNVNGSVLWLHCTLLYCTVFIHTALCFIVPYIVFIHNALYVNVLDSYTLPCKPTLGGQHSGDVQVFLCDD